MNNKPQQKNFLSWSILLLALILICFGLLAHGQTAVASPDVNPNWGAPVQLTFNTYGAAGPIVSSSPDGKTVMIVYNRHMTATEGNNDPYYRRSQDNGETWSTPKPIHTSAATESRQVYLDYAANGVAHVAWQENKGLAYAHEDGKNSDSWIYKVLVNPISPPSPGVSSPFIVASGSSRVDIVWAEGNSSSPDPNIYHIRSNYSGSTFDVAKKVVFNSGWASQFPSMVVEDQTGVVHLVWQEPYDFFAPEKGSIVYSRGTEQANGKMYWTPPIEISTVTDAREPEIMLANSTLHVVYTDYRSDDEQYVRHTQCSSGCANLSNWQATTNAISGQIAGANGVDPLNLVSDIVQWANCTVVYFHGTIIGTGIPDNEVVWGVDSCTGWGASARDQVTTTSVRSINPNLAVQNNWWLYLAYEQGISTTRQIYFHRAKPDLYLPVVFK